MKPVETRKIFEAKGWSKIAAFQTRNPMHRSHEYLAKIAIETMDGVLIHQILGKLKEGDIPADVRADAINTLMDKYFVKDSAVQCGYPMECGMPVRGRPSSTRSSGRTSAAAT